MGLILPLVSSKGLRPPLKKVCFLSSGWRKSWPLGRPQILFVQFFFLVFFYTKITEIFEEKKKNRKLGKKKKKKDPCRHKYSHPAAGLETNFFFKGGLRYIYVNDNHVIVPIYVGTRTRT